MANKLKPLGKRVLIQLLEKGEKTTKSGLILVEKAPEKTVSARVLAVGDVEIVKVDDVVWVSQYGYDEIEYDGEKYGVISEANLLAVL